MTTKQKIKYIEELLEKENCPLNRITPLAMIILRDVEKNNKSVYDIVLEKK